MIKEAGGARHRGRVRRPGGRRARGATYATNDQVAYGKLGAEWLVKQLGGKGNVVEMRGIAASPPTTTATRGSRRSSKQNPGIKVVKADVHRLVVRAGRQAGARHPELGHEGRRRLDVGHRLRRRRRVQDGRASRSCRSSVPTTTSSCEQLLAQYRSSGRRGDEPGHDRRRRARRSRSTLLERQEPAEVGQADARRSGTCPAQGRRSRRTTTPKLRADVHRASCDQAVDDVHDGPAHGLQGAVASA